MSRKKRNKKRFAVSPLISAIILIAITIAGGLVAFAVWNSMAGTSSEKTQVNFDYLALYKTVGKPEAVFAATLKNAGNKPIKLLIIKLHNETAYTVPSINASSPLEPGWSVGVTLTPPNIHAEWYIVGNFYTVTIVKAEATDDSSFSHVTTVMCLGSGEAPAYTHMSFNVLGLHSYGPVLIVDGVEYSHPDLPLEFTWKVGSVHTYFWWGAVRDVYNPSNYMWTVGAWDQTTGIVEDKAGVVTVPKGGGNITAEYKPGYYFYDDFETGDFRKETVYTKFVQPWYYSNASVETADVGGGNYSASFFTTGQSPSGLQWSDSNIPAWAYKTLPSDWGNEIWLDFKAKSTGGDVALFSSIFPLCSMSIRGGMGQRYFDPPKYSALVLTYTGSKFQLSNLHTILGHEDDDAYFSHELGTYPADQWYDICIVLNRNGHEGWVKVFINGDQKCFLTLDSTNAPDFYAYGTPNMVLVGEYREFTPGTTLIDDLMLFTSRYIPEAFRETCDSGEALVTFDTNWDIDMNQDIVEIDNVIYPRWQLPESYAWSIGSTHHYAFLTKNVEDGKRYEVTRVSGLSNNAQGSITVPEKGGTLFADYTLQYRLRILPALNGSVNPATGEHWYNAGSTVQVTATPDLGNIFAYWMLDGEVRTENPITLTMSQKHELEAIFALPSSVTFCCNVGSDANAPVLTVDGVDYYYGQLPKTFTHPVNSPHTFNWNYPIGTTETGKVYFWTTTSGLTTAQSGVLAFPDGGGQVNATYTVKYALSISTTDGGTTDPAPGTYWYNVGTNVSVMAIPDAGCSFDYWLLNDINVGSANPLTVQMSSHHVLEAAFFSGPVISERITNGGFEDFSLGWTGTGEITGWGHTGEQCLMLYGDEWMQSDNLGNMPAENITYFGFYYIYDEGTTYTIFYTDATNSSDTLTYTGYWTYVDLMLKLVSGKEVSSIYFHGQPGEIAYLDDVSLVADGVERVLNGGFETIIVPGWTGTGGVSGSEAHGGNYSLVLSGSEWYPPIRWMQTNDLGSIPVKRVNSFGFYCISQDFYYRGAVTYTILYTDGSNSSGYISPSTTWEYVDLMPLLVLGKNVSAIHFVSERDNPIWIDDVSLIANNMPLSWYEGVFTISRSDFAVEAYNDFTFTVKLYVASLNQTLGTEMHIIQVHEVEGDYVGCQTVNVYLYVNSSGAYIHAVGGNIGWEGETPMGSGYHECSLGEWHSIYYEHLYIESGDYEHWSFQVDGDELFSGDTLAWSYSYNSITLGSFGAPDPESNFTLYYDAVCWTAGTGDFESSFPGDWTIQGTVGLSTAQSVSPSHSLKVPMIDEPLSVTVTPENAVIGKNTTQTFEAVVAGGSLPYTYAWYVNGTLWMREPVELLTNGNFETGDLSGWQHGGSVGATTDLVHAGSYACEISGSGSYIGQTFTGVPKDKIVSFGFWQRTVGYGQRGIVTIEYNDGTHTVVEADTTGYTWKYVNLLPYVETSKTVTGARFSHNGVASPYYYIDDISLISTEIPETSPTLQFRTEDVSLYEIWCIVTDSTGNTDQSNIVLCSVEE